METDADAKSISREKKVIASGVKRLS